MFFVRCVFFSKYGHVRLQTLYLQVNSFPEILDSSDWFRQYEYLVYRQYLGQYVDICLLFFFNMMVKQIPVFYGYIIHPNLVGNMAVFLDRFGYPIATPNLPHFGLKFLFWKLS